MSRTYSKDFRQRVACFSLVAEQSVQEVSNVFGISVHCVNKWVRRFSPEFHRVKESIVRSKKQITGWNEMDSEEFKKKVVKAYLIDGRTIVSLERQFDVSRDDIFRWTAKYGKEFCKRSVAGTTDSEKYTPSFKKKIVLLFLDNGLELSKIEQVYKVPRSTVLKWVDEYATDLNLEPGADPIVELEDSTASFNFEQGFGSFEGFKKEPEVEQTAKQEDFSFGEFEELEVALEESKEEPSPSVEPPEAVKQPKVKTKPSKVKTKKSSNKESEKVSAKMNNEKASVSPVITETNRVTYRPDFKKLVAFVKIKTGLSSILIGEKLDVSRKSVTKWSQCFKNEIDSTFDYKTIAEKYGVKEQITELLADSATEESEEMNKGVALAPVKQTGYPDDLKQLVAYLRNVKNISHKELTKLFPVSKASITFWSRHEVDPKFDYKVVAEKYGLGEGVAQLLKEFSTEPVIEHSQEKEVTGYKTRNQGSHYVYDEYFKELVAYLSLKEGATTDLITEVFGVGSTTIARWRRDYRSKDFSGFNPDAVIKKCGVKEQVQQIRKRNKRFQSPVKNVAYKDGIKYQVDFKRLMVYEYAVEGISAGVLESCFNIGDGCIRDWCKMYLKSLEKDTEFNPFLVIEKYDIGNELEQLKSETRQNSRNRTSGSEGCSKRSSKYPEDLKKLAVYLNVVKGVPVVKVERTLGIASHRVYDWRELYMDEVTSKDFNPNKIIEKYKLKSRIKKLELLSGDGVRYPEDFKKSPVQHEGKKKANTGIRYSEEFRKQVVRRLLDGESFEKLESEYDVSTTSLKRWIVKYRDEIKAEQKKPAITDTPVVAEPSVEYQTLEQQLAELKKDNDFLKEALALFMKRMTD